MTTAERSLTDPTTETIVRTALAAAGLHPSEDEVEAFVADYPMIQAMVAMIRDVPAAQYESPVLHFDPTPTFADWHTEPED